jgi:hypothetical protein
MRSFWTGEIAFGLVTIPVKLYTATRDLTPQFRLLHKECGTPIVTIRCPKHNRDLTWDEIGKGYEVGKGEYALLAKEELAKLEGDEAGGTVEIVEFVNPLDVDNAYIERSYWVGPASKNVRGYQLLRGVLENRKRVALAKVRLRTRTRLAQLAAEQIDTPATDVYDSLHLPPRTSRRRFTQLCREGEILGAHREGRHWVCDRTAWHTARRRENQPHQTAVPALSQRAEDLLRRRGLRLLPSAISSSEHAGSEDRRRPDR